MKGVLKEKVPYKDTIQKKYGNPKAVSNNGQVFIFQKSKTLILNVIIMSLHGLHFIKSIDINKDIKAYLNLLGDQKPTEEIKKLEKSLGEGGEFKDLDDPN